MTKVVNIKKSPYVIRHPEYVYIGRGSIYGNPFSHLDFGTSHVRVETREEAIGKYHMWLRGQIHIDELVPPSLDEIKQLRGKLLGCFCTPKGCHGDVLIGIINSGVL